MIFLIFMNDVFEQYTFFIKIFIIILVNPAFVAYKYSRSMTIPPRQLPLDNYSHEISPRTILPGLLTPPTPPRLTPHSHTHTHKCPWITAPWTTTTRTIAPQGNYPSVFCPSDNCTWIIPPWTTYPQTIAPHEITPRTIIRSTYTPRQLPVNNSSLDNSTRQLPFMKSPRTINPRNLASKTITSEWLPWATAPGQLPPWNSRL